MNLQIPIKRALISVSDKTGIVDLAKKLNQLGCEIISTGGTRKKLEEAGIPIIDISRVTGNPEAFGGRMKTISFNIESALLFDRVKDREEAASLGIEPINLVVCNLYPFKKVMEEGAELEELIENIDIGGPTMIRAAAKNFKYVGVLTRPDAYTELIEELEENEGSISYGFRKRMMTEAFNHTADYDAKIATAMDKEVGVESLRMAFADAKTLRYGENSHQKAAFYRSKAAEKSLHDLNVLHGKALSFNNILDINGAIESVRESTGNACAVIKHSNPCGYCEGPDQRKALELAWEGDPISAFGSLIAFNRPLKRNTVEYFELDNPDRFKRKFVEVVIAPKIEADALEYLQNHKNLRVIEFDVSALPEYDDLRFMNGSLLAQGRDNVLFEKMEVATQKAFDLGKDQGLVEFGLRAIKNIKSNSIAIVRRKDDYFQLLGMGAGQPNRLVATKLSIDKSRENLRNEYEGPEDAFSDYFKEEMGKAVLISDAFFPFPDNVELAAGFGVRNIVQPGGSIRDKAVVETCDKLGVSMIFTGIRHFKH